MTSKDYLLMGRGQLGNPQRVATGAAHAMSAGQVRQRGPRVVIARLVLAVAMILSLPAWAAGEAEDLYARGKKAFASGDLNGAMPLFKKAADQGFAPAQAAIGEIMEQAEFNDEAIAYYRKSADQGNAEGQFGLAGMYAEGKGVKRDFAQALAWFAKAAEQGYVDAINVLAGAYLKGGLELDEKARASETALRWIKLAAEHDYLPAVESLARAYQEGKYGLTADAQQAQAWEAKAKALKTEALKAKPAGDKTKKAKD